jgi:glucose/arabinose dehydrogenase
MFRKAYAHHCRTARFAGSLLGLVLGLSTFAEAATPLDLSPVASGLSGPLFLTAPAGDERLFIVERGGQIKLWESGLVQPTPFLDISTLVDSAGERGLLGLAFDPDYASNRRFFVNYIDKTSLNTVVASFTVPLATPNQADLASRQTVLTVAQPAGRNNHKAGWIGFRPDEPDHLYIATGDGGGANDPENRAQNPDDNLGKILRVDVSPASGYVIPADNPYAGVPGNDEIWALGLRNPFRNSFDRQTGDFYIADVGQGAREEIDFEAGPGSGGRNYGWRALEGSADNPAVADLPPPDAVAPIFDYAHGTLGQTVIGGYVYRGSAIPDLEGVYFFGDFVSGGIYSFRYDGTSVSEFTDRTAELGNPFGAFQLSSFGEDSQGELYALGLDGTVYKVIPVPEPAPALMMAAALALLLARRGLRRI